jgi:hypothetical protein
MTSARTVAVLAGLVTASCAAADTKTATTTPSASSRTGASGGELPVLHLVLWAQQWPRILQAVPKLAALQTTMPDMASFWGLAKDGLAALGVTNVALPPAGLEPIAPVALDVFPARKSFETAALTLAINSGTAVDVGDMAPRVRITLPARDVAELAAALEPIAKARANVAIVRGDNVVAIDISLSPGKPPTDVSAPMRETVPDDSAARGVLRADGIAEIGASLGVSHMATFLTTSSPAAGDIPRMLASGLAEVITGYVLSDPSTSVADALVVEVPAAADATAEVAFALSRAGTTALTAAGFAPGGIELVGELKWDAAATSIPSSPLIAASTGKDAAREAATALQECGSSCFVYLALGNGLQLGEAGRDMMFAAAKELAARLQLRWDAGDMIAVSGAGTSPQTLPRPALAKPASAAAQCYRKALVEVRKALRGAVEQPARIAGAYAALDGAAACTGGDPVVSKRAGQLREAVVQLQARLGAAK